MEGEPYKIHQLKYRKHTIYLGESDVGRYNRWMLEDIAERRKREEQKKKEEAEKEKSFDEKHNIKRDSKGRLNKGALLAKKMRIMKQRYIFYLQPEQVQRRLWNIQRVLKALFTVLSANIIKSSRKIDMA